MDAFFGGGAGAARARGPRPRERRGQDALIRLEIEPREAAFGVTRELKVDTAVLCAHLPRRGCGGGHAPAPVRDLPRRRRGAHVQRSFLGEIRTLRPCAACRGFGRSSPTCAGVPGEAGCARAARSRSRSRPASTPAPGSSSSARARSAPAVARPATSRRDPRRPARAFTRHGHDLRCAITLPMTAAALGTRSPCPRWRPTSTRTARASTPS